ncbi:glycosyltransferase family 4 protein [Vibrio mediterranei]|uniref:Glycosyltransferase n=1 Tax=Vibrio mediterranei TaxID=689 RepID=A0AAN1KME7_9VIBR|nr:glycosyltransferase family 4 protein [Vibrio mediterranei]ASI89247.1 hypothetical protein BSZ05_05175 [Vibrio mediterranei]
MKKILIPRLSIGRSGGERVLARLADELIELGYVVEFIIYDSSTHYYRTKAKTTNLNIEIGKSYFSQLKATYKFSRVIKSNYKNAIVLFNHHLTSLMYPIISQNKSLYCIGYIQARESKFQTVFLKRLICELTYKFKYPKIVNSEYLFDTKLKNEIGLVPPGIDCEKYAGDKMNNSEFNIGILGRKEPYKGTLISLKAVEMVARESNRAIVLNVGLDMPDFDLPPIKNLKINHLKIDSESELQSFYKRNNLMLASGLIEDGAFHYPCAESMASKVMVISNWSPLSETSSPFKVVSTDVAKLKEKIELFMSLSDEDIKKEVKFNYDYVKSRYDWKSIGLKFASLIEDEVYR